LLDHIEIAPYDPAWATAFEAERDRLARALGSLARRIDHNGSTSVVGLDAKPVIDIQISVDALNPLDAYGRPLSVLGYTHVPDPDDAVCPFFHRPEAWPHTHHVHVVSHGGAEERRTLAFRDYLRDHDDVMRDYAALKTRLAPGYRAADPSAREAYAAAKAGFIEHVIQLALAAGYPHPS